MKNTKSPMPAGEPLLSWKFSKRRSKFIASGQSLLTLKTVSRNKSVFEYDNRNFTIRNIGFWSPAIVIEENRVKVAIIKRSFSGNKAFMVFENGTRYVLKAKNNILVKLSIYDQEQQEIISYRMISKFKASLHVDPSINYKESIESLAIIVAGCYIFRTILKENKLINLKTLTFIDSLSKNKLTDSDTQSTIFESPATT